MSLLQQVSPRFHFFPIRPSASSSRIIISPILAREIRAENIFVRGEVEGNTQAASRVVLLEAGVLIGDVKSSSLTVDAGSRMRGKVEFGSDERGAGVDLPGSGPPTSIRLYPPSALVSVGSSYSRYQPGTYQESSLREGPAQLGGHFRLLIHPSF